MRVDKYLWSVRLFKTRATAAEAAKKNRISVNGQHCKASREVKPGDRLRVRREMIDFDYQVLELPKSRVGAKLVEKHLLNTTTPEQLEKMELMRLSRLQYQNSFGDAGRPTKKDRRSIDDYTEDWSFLDDDDDVSDKD